MKSREQIIEAIDMMMIHASVGDPEHVSASLGIASALSWVVGKTSRPEINELAAAFEEMHVKSNQVLDQANASVRDIFGQEPQS